MTYKLKSGQEAFEMVDGPFAGKIYTPGKPYEQVPPGYEERFEKETKISKPEKEATGRTVEPSLAEQSEKKE